MKGIAKILKAVILVIIVLVVILIMAFYLFGERAVKIGVETAGTKALGVGVTIDSVDLSVLKGAVGINGLIVENPAGYAHKDLLELNNGRVKVRIKDLLGDTVHIEQLKLDGVNLVIEQKGLSNNLQDVLNSLPKAEKSEPSGKKLQIDELDITNVNVKVKLLPVPGRADTITLKLDPIRMQNLGSDNKLDTAMLTSKVLLALAAGVTKQGVGVLPKEIVDTMQSTLGKTLDVGQGVLKEGGKILEKGKDTGTEIIEGFKGLLKPKKKE